MKRLLQGKELKEKAKELGVDLNEYIPSDGLKKVDATDEVLQARVIQAESHLQNKTLAIVAITSSAAAVISALVALISLFIKP